jgi:hypothetical protein
MKKENFITLLFSLLSGARINLVGQLFGSEAISLLFFPIGKIRKIIALRPVRKILFPYALFLVSLIISDLFVNYTSPANFLRGWFNIVFSLIQIVFLVHLFLKGEKNYTLYLIGGAVSFFIFRPQMEGDFNLEGNFFKIYFMFGVNYLIILLSYKLGKKNRKLPLAIFLLYSVFCMIADARSNGVIFFLSGMIYFMKLKKIQFTPIKIFISSVFLVAFGYAGYVFYASKVLDGDVGGANAQQIAKLKNPYNPLELIKEGRLDALFALIPIMDKPIMGFGSWAEDNTGKYNLIYAKMADSKPGNERDSNLIPAHSVVLAAWLWAGLGGLIGVSILYFRIFNWGWILFSSNIISSEFDLMLLVP